MLDRINMSIYDNSGSENNTDRKEERE